jgi:putative ABC transport system substrate-binding protein
MPVRNADEIVRAIDAFAAEPNGGLIVLPPAPTTTIRDTMFQLTAQHRLPAISSLATAAAGGLTQQASSISIAAPQLTSTASCAAPW